VDKYNRQVNTDKDDDSDDEIFNDIYADLDAFSDEDDEVDFALYSSSDESDDDLLPNPPGRHVPLICSEIPARPSSSSSSSRFLPNYAMFTWGDLI